MDKPFTILPDAPAMPGAKASPFYVQKEKKGEQKSYRTITHWHDELECLTILDGTLDFQLNESVISLQKGSTLIVLPGAIHRNLPKPEDTVFMRILANPALLTANEEIREKLEKTSRGLGVKGGPNSPLGARAMYLFSQGGGHDLGYRIHGTTEPETIGTNVSSGCIRMVNQDIVHLYTRASVKTPVIVLT